MLHYKKGKYFLKVKIITELQPEYLHFVYHIFFIQHAFFIFLFKL